MEKGGLTVSVSCNQQASGKPMLETNKLGMALIPCMPASHKHLASLCCTRWILVRPSKAILIREHIPMYTMERGVLLCVRNVQRPNADTTSIHLFAQEHQTAGNICDI